MQRKRVLRFIEPISIPRQLQNITRNEQPSLTPTSFASGNEHSFGDEDFALVFREPQEPTDFKQ